MPRVCCQCGTEQSLLLHAGLLFCRDCLEYVELPLSLRILLNHQRAILAAREACRLRALVRSELARLRETRQAWCEGGQRHLARDQAETLMAEEGEEEA